MSLKDLEQYQEIWRRSWIDINSPDLSVSMAQEKRAYAIRMNRRENFQTKELPEKVYMNHNMKWYLKTEITEEMELLEEEWSISYLDYVK